MTKATSDVPESGPETIEQVAVHMLSIHDDLLDDDEDLPDVMDETTALEIVRREYVSGTCGAFAIALHDITGWPIVGINGGMHLAVRSPDGMILDYMGLSKDKAVLRRYGMVRAPILEWTREETVDHVMMGDDERGPWDDLAVARWVADRGGAWTPHTISATAKA
jgi:hypothetical protein